MDAKPAPRSVPFLVQFSWFMLAVCALTLVVFAAGFWGAKADEAYKRGLAEGAAKCASSNS